MRKVSLSKNVSLNKRNNHNPYTVILRKGKVNLSKKSPLQVVLSNRVETLLYNAIVLLEEFKDIEQLKAELGMSDEEYSQVME